MNRRPLAVALAAVAALLVTALAGFAARSGPWAPALPRSTAVAHTAPPLKLPLPPAAGPSAATASPTVPTSPDGGVTAILVIAVVTVLVVLGAAMILAAVWQRPRFRARFRRRDPALLSPAADPAAGLPAAVERALDVVDDVARQPDAREAVVRAWLLLGDAAAAAGTPPRPAETAAEYSARLAAEQGLPAASVRRLAALYREARFSAHDVGDDDRERARAELLALQAALREPAGGSRRAPR